jgi:hypothetical protein
MNSPTNFTPDMHQEELTKAIKMEELAETYKELKTKAAPGPSGIRNTQWKNAPVEMQLIILDLFNNINV